MKVSELTSYIAPIDSTANGQSHLAFNYQGTSEGTPGTYRITFENLGKALSNGIGLIYPSSNQSLSKYTINNGAYIDSFVGRYLNNNQYDHLNNIAENANRFDMEYDGNNKKLTKTINGITTEVVTTATLKNHMSLNNVENKSSATIRSELTSSDVTTALGYTPLNSALKGANNGVAELDSSGKVPSSQLPSYVDDVIEGYFYNDAFYEEAAHTNAITGESSKIYVDLGGGRAIYRYSGSAFVEIPASPISDIQINGTSIISNYVATIPIASTSALGIIKIPSQDRGLELFSDNNDVITIRPATEAQIKAATNYYCPVGPARQHVSVFYGLAKAAGDSTQAASDNAVGTYTTDAQASIRTMIGAGTYSKPSGGIPATDLADTYLTSETLFLQFLNNFDITLSLPTAVTWNVDSETNRLYVIPDKYDTTTGITIQKQSGNTWVTYDGISTRTGGEHFRAYCTRTLTFNSKTYTNSGVVGEEYIEPSSHILTINYIYEDTTEAATTYTESITEGTNYVVNSPEITGFTPNPAMYAGVMGPTDITLTVTYIANE